MTKYLHPKYWLSWIGIGFWWLSSQLPWCWQMRMGGSIGLIFRVLLTKRRKVCMTNLSIAFPDKSESERQALCKAHFISLGKGLLDASFSWWGRRKSLQLLSHIEGEEHLESALVTKRPIIFLPFSQLNVFPFFVLPSIFFTRKGVTVSTRSERILNILKACKGSTTA